MSSGKMFSRIDWVGQSRWEGERYIKESEKEWETEWAGNTPPSHQNVAFSAIWFCVLMLHFCRHAKFGHFICLHFLWINRFNQADRRLAGRPQRATLLVGRGCLLWVQTGQFDCRRGHEWCHVAVILALGREKWRHVEPVLVAIRERLRQTTQQRQG